MARLRSTKQLSAHFKTISVQLHGSSRKATLLIFPEIVLGKLSRNSISLGYL